MVAWHFNFEFQIHFLLKGTKELGVAPYSMGLPIIKFDN
jgi:hypothetical protein